MSITKFLDKWAMFRAQTHLPLKYIVPLTQTVRKRQHLLVFTYMRARRRPVAQFLYKMLCLCEDLLVWIAIDNCILTY